MKDTLERKHGPKTQSPCPTSSGEEEWKRGKRARQKTVKKVVDVKFGNRRSHNVGKGSTEKATPKNDYKDDFWLYDPVSDGYYYQQNGCRGWRKRPVGFVRAGEGTTHIDQEAFVDMMKEQGAVFKPFDMYPGVPMDSAYATPQIRYYDPASDGYYYEMASVDGWKRRQPGSNLNVPPYAGINGGKLLLLNPNHQMYSPQDYTFPISYGAALARGELPPAYRIAEDTINSENAFFSQDTVSSAESSTSSLSEDTATPPLQTPNNASSTFADNTFNGLLSEQYGKVLSLDEVVNNAALEKLFSETGSNTEPTFSFSNSKSTYAKVAAASCDNDDLENKPPFSNSSVSRPITLGIETEFEENLSLNDDVGGKKKGRELLLNFNVDKFIEDLELCGSNPERVLRDLASLKTPVTVTSICAVDSPVTPTVLSANPKWFRSNKDETDFENSRNCDDSLFHIDSIDFDDSWPTQFTTPIGKSKLSMWRSPGLRDMIACDNN